MQIAQIVEFLRESAPSEVCVLVGGATLMAAKDEKELNTGVWLLIGFDTTPNTSAAAGQIYQLPIPITTTPKGTP